MFIMNQRQETPFNDKNERKWSSDVHTWNNNNKRDSDRGATRRKAEPAITPGDRRRRGESMMSVTFQLSGKWVKSVMLFVNTDVIAVFKSEKGKFSGKDQSLWGKICRIDYCQNSFINIVPTKLLPDRIWGPLWNLLIALRPFKSHCIRFLFNWLLRTTLNTGRFQLNFQVT